MMGDTLLWYSLVNVFLRYSRWPCFSMQGESRFTEKSLPTKTLSEFHCYFYFYGSMLRRPRIDGHGLEDHITWCRFVMEICFKFNR